MPIRASIANRQTSVLTVALIFAAIGIGFVGTNNLRSSSADTAYTHNPDGDVDSCALVNNVTTLYGWVNDPDAPAGANPYLGIRVNATVNANIPSDIAGYRDAAVNNYIHTKYPGMPTSSVYGWKTSFPGLYKGGKYTVSGAISNYGPGSNVAIPINTTHYVDGDSSKTYFLSGGIIPDACLASQPVATPPPASPPPVSAPVAKPPTTTKTPAKSATPTAVSSSADATVTTGITTAQIQIPAGAASSAHIIYGTDASKLDKTTDDQPIGSNGLTIALNNLFVKTTYYFQIVRTLNGASATSPNASFTTNGYSVSITMISKGKPVEGIKGTLNKQQSVSGKDGKLHFDDVAAGSFSIIFNYQGHTYSQTINTADTTSTNPEAVTIDQAIDLDTLLPSAIVTSKTPAAHHAAWPLLLGIFIGLIVVGGSIWFFIRKRRASSANPYALPTVDVLEQHSRNQLKKKDMPAAEPLPAHAGMSIREMVVESIREEAKRRNQPPTDPPA